jgi:hypothetical protein
MFCFSVATIVDVLPPAAQSQQEYNLLMPTIHVSSLRFGASHFDELH